AWRGVDPWSSPPIGGLVTNRGHPTCSAEGAQAQRHYVITLGSAFAGRWGLTNRIIDGMLTGIRKNLGARSLLVALLACAPLLAISGTQHAAQEPPLRVSLARVNPSPHAIPSYKPSKRHNSTPPQLPQRNSPPPLGQARVEAAEPLVSGPGTGPQLIQDPGFEFGLPDPYWPEYSQAGFEIITPTNPHSGRCAVDFCGYTNDTPACLDSVSQLLNFNVPSGIVSAELSYWFWVGSQETVGTCTDYMTIGIYDLPPVADPSNAATYCASDWGDQLWHNQSINVTAYLQNKTDKRLSVTIQGIDDANGKGSEFFVDDVALSIYTAPAAPTNVLAQPDNSEATVSWQAPVDGGAPIQSYTITPYANGTTAGTPVTFNSPSNYEVISGLLNG